MKKLFREEIDELAAMKMAALQRRCQEEFGEAPASAHRQFLFRKIVWRMQADPESAGGLCAGGGGRGVDAAAARG